MFLLYAGIYAELDITNHWLFNTQVTLYEPRNRIQFYIAYWDRKYHIRFSIPNENNLFIINYIKPCFIFKAILEGYGIDASKIKIFEIENDPEMQAIQNHMGKITGGSTVPRIFIGGKFVGGCDEVNFKFSRFLNFYFF